MHTLKCLVVDDEPMAIEVIEDYISKVPFLSLSHSSTDAIEALDFLKTNHADLIFLDINMPDLSGLQFLKSLVNKPCVIFTTAYSEYAVESYEYNAIDYLLKPIAFTRFLKAVNKAYDLLHPGNITATAAVEKQGADSKKSVFIKSGAEIHQLNTDEILYVEGLGNYVSFISEDKKILSLLTMQEVLDMLPGNQFARVHKSYIVSVQKIDTIERHQLWINNIKIPIGKIYKEGFLKRIR